MSCSALCWSHSASVVQRKRLSSSAQKGPQAAKETRVFTATEYSEYIEYTEYTEYTEYKEYKEYTEYTEYTRSA